MVRVELFVGERKGAMLLGVVKEVLRNFFEETFVSKDQGGAVRAQHESEEVRGGRYKPVQCCHVLLRMVKYKY